MAETPPFISGPPAPVKPIRHLPSASPSPEPQLPTEGPRPYSSVIDTRENPIWVQKIAESTAQVPLWLPQGIPPDTFVVFPVMREGEPATSVIQLTKIKEGINNQTAYVAIETTIGEWKGMDQKKRPLLLEYRELIKKYPKIKRTK